MSGLLAGSGVGVARVAPGLYANLAKNAAAARTAGGA
jgi:hypothetical protein